MGGLGKSKSSTTQSQSSTTSPWAPTQPLLQQIIGGIGGQYPNVAPTGAETNALNSLQQSAAGIPNFTGQASDLVSRLFSGGTDRTGMVNDAYSQYQKALTPYLQQSYLDPTQNPAMKAVLDTIRSDVGNSVNGMFAGAGRDLSGYNTQALARGIAQGEAQPLLNQYNQNAANQLNAAGNLFGAGGTTAGLFVRPRPDRAE